MSKGEQSSGGVSNLCKLFSVRTGGTLIRRFFSRAPEFLRFKTTSKPSNAESFQGIEPPRHARRAYLFSPPPGGSQKFCRFNSGPVAKQHKLFRLFPKSFFWRPFFKNNCRVIQGGGVGR